MKISLLCIVLATAVLLLTSFVESIESKEPDSSRGEVQIKLEYSRQGVIASNQFAVWIEDMQGNNDSMWKPHCIGKMMSFIAVLYLLTEKKQHFRQLPSIHEYSTGESAYRNMLQNGSSSFARK